MNEHEQRILEQYSEMPAGRKRAGFCELHHELFDRLMAEQLAEPLNRAGGTEKERKFVGILSSLTELLAELGHSFSSSGSNAEGFRELALKQLLQADRDAGAESLGSYVQEFARASTNEGLVGELRSLANGIENEKSIRRKPLGIIQVVEVVFRHVRNAGTMPTIEQIEAQLLEQNATISQKVRNEALDAVTKATGHEYPRAPRNS